MALGTAEATPLQVAAGYTTFANLGEATSPIAINRVTTGDGRVVVEPKTEKKTVLRSDVAYIMDDIMKDVINRGTAAEAQAWGFKNVAGKRGFAGKTGTSRDGWFAGFTPELVTVVYVGFDDNSDLGMKGSDSAMPIWADFMSEALKLNPDWNADWQMPETVRQGEIDTRSGKLIRELNTSEADSVKAQQTTIKNAKNNSNANTNSENSDENQPPKELYVTDVPAEFRRVEYFVGGTMPTRALIPVDENQDANPQPEATTTPFATWQEEQTQKGNTNSQKTPDDLEGSGVERNITVMICPTSGMRAGLYCPTKQPQTFILGSEPKEFCPFHTQPPN